MNNEKKFIKLTPFKMQVLQSFPFIDEDFDAITNYELLCKVVEYLNKTVDNVDLLNEKIEEFQDYFDNLDVQEEINNKLDEMAESGELTNIIKSYVDIIFNNYSTQVDNQINNQNERINNIDNLVSSAISGTPIVVSSIDDMTDTTKIYILTSDGKWYYYNGNAWTIGGTYQSTGIGEGTINYIDFDNITSSLYGIKDVVYETTDNYYVNYQGILASNTSYLYTSPIALKKGETIICNTSGTPNAVSVISEINDDVYTPLILSISQNDNYYYYTATKDTNIVLSGKKTNLSKVKILKLTNYDALNEISDIENIINTSDLIDNEYIAYANGTNLTNSGYKRTDYIECMENTEIQITATNVLVPSPTGSGIAFYDANKIFISGIQYPASTTLTVTTPPKTKYIRYSCRKATLNQQIKYKNVLLSIYNKQINSTELNNYYDFSLFTKIGVLGDSYASGCFGENSSSTTAPEHYEMSWPSMLQRNYGFTLHNFSYGGLSTRSFISTGRLNTLLNTEKCDLYILTLERNDYNIENRGETGYLGSIEDIDGVTLPDYPDTFYGNYGRIIENILTYSPNSKLIMMSGDYTSSNLLGTQYNQAMEEIANYYNIPIIKQLDDSYFNSLLYRQNWPSGGHPGAVQYNGMSKAIDRLLNKCLQENINYFKYTNPII